MGVGIAGEDGLLLAVAAITVPLVVGMGMVRLQTQRRGDGDRQRELGPGVGFARRGGGGEVRDGISIICTCPGFASGFRMKTYPHLRL